MRDVDLRGVSPPRFVTLLRGFIVGVVFLVGCAHSDPLEDRAALQSAAEDTIDAFAQTNGAIVAWTNTDSTSTTSYKYFSVDLEEDLIALGQPIALLASLEDVWRSDSVFYAAFTERDWSYRGGSPDVVFELEVPSSLVEMLLAQRGEKYSDEHLIVARINRIFRPRLGMRSDAIPDGEFMYVETDPQFPTVFIARGELVMFRYVAGGLRQLISR